MFCLTLLLRLTPTGRTKLRYTRTVSAALLCWTTWFDISPGIVRVEESCEAMLSKVARNVRTHHTASNHTQYTDLFLSIRTSKAYHDMRGGVSDRILQTVRHRLRVLLTSQIVPPHVVWSGSAGQRTTARHAGVPVNNDGAVPLLEPLPRQVFTDTMQHCVRTLIGGREMTAADEALFSLHFRRRTADELVDVDLQYMEADIPHDARPGRPHVRRPGRRAVSPH